MGIRLLGGLAGVLFFGGICASSGQRLDPVDALKLTKVDTTRWKLTFDDADSGATGYEVFASPDLTPGSFERVEATVNQVTPGSWEAIVAGLPSDRVFLRVELLGVGGPVFAYFDPSEVVEVNEGGTSQVTVYFSGFYSGPLNYSFSGNALIVEPSGMVMVNGRSAVIEIEFEEDDSVNELSYLSLALSGGVEDYTLGEAEGETGQIQLIVTDNDSSWLGGFQALEVDFDLQLEVIDDGGGIEARLFGSETSVIPVASAPGYYSASSANLTAADFEVVFSGIEIPANSQNQLGAGARLNLTLSGDTVGEDLISGTARLDVVFANRPHMDTRIDGDFTISKRPAVQPNPTVSFE